MKKYLLGIFLLFCSIFCLAQNDLHYSHFIQSPLIFNPAHAGSSNNLITHLIGRQQWVGMNNAPSSQIFNGHTYLDEVHGGVGATILNDKLGFENSFTLRLHYAYHLRISEKATFAAGTGLGFVHKSLNASKLIFEETGDENAAVSKESKFSPDFNLGFELNTAKLSVGVSSTHVDESVESADIFKVTRHLFTYAKYNIKANEDVTIVPALLCRSTLFITQFEVNTNVIYQKKVWVGVSYRQQEAFVGLIGYYINEKLKVGYSYDYTPGNLKSYSNGSHEIFVAGTFKSLSKKKHHYKTPRFFN